MKFWIGLHISPTTGLPELVSSGYTADEARDGLNKNVGTMHSLQEVEVEDVCEKCGQSN